jgi:hypothetical protein
MPAERRWTTAVSSVEGGEATVTCEAADWQAAYTVRAIGGRLAIASVLIEPRAHAADNPPPLSATMARDLLATRPVLRKAREELPEVAVALRYVAGSGATPLASDFDEGFVAGLASVDQNPRLPRCRHPDVSRQSRASDRPDSVGFHGTRSEWHRL